MADLSAIRQTSDNSGNAITTAYLSANNYKNVISQSDVGRELIIKVAKTDMTDAELNTIIAAITTQRSGGDSAFTIGAVGTATGVAFESGATDVVFLRAQGTGVYTAVGSNAHGVSGAVTTIEAIFTPAK
jgi:hypothetical protein